MAYLSTQLKDAGHVFSFREEILAYCHSDVDILLPLLPERNEIYIQHARNGGEKRIGRYLLDGYHEETHTAYEIHGCFWHGTFELLFLLMMEDGPMPPNITMNVKLINK